VIHKVIACYACNQARGRIECKLAKSEAHTIATNEDLPANQKKRDHKQLYQQPYQERKRRLKRLKDRVEQDIEGLVAVMGLPLTQQKQR